MVRTGAFRIAAVAAILTACGGNTSRPGADKSAKSRANEAASQGLKDRSPLAAFSVYLNGFHFQNGNGTAQMEEHHFCAKVNEDITQCILFDGSGETAHLTGVEYVITRSLFESLKADERKLWHSHVYEVKSGQLVAPGVPESVEGEIMSQFVSTYGKIWHTWNSQHNEPLPVGVPSLMMGFTGDNQLKAELLQFRDERLQVSAADKRKLREVIPDTTVAADANSWEQGTAWQLQVTPVKPSRNQGFGRRESAGASDRGRANGQVQKAP